jgi:ankyrin repeat protein
MTGEIFRALVQLAGVLEFEILCKATMVFAVGLALVQFTNRRAAYVRHLALAGTFGATLLLPFIAFLAPPVEVGLAVPAPAAVRSPAMDPPNPQKSIDKHDAGIRVGSDQTVAGLLPDWTGTLRFVWATGTMLMLLVLALEVWRLRQLCRDGVPRRGLDARLQALSEERGLGGRHVQLLQHGDLAGPITCGFRPAVVLMPQDAASWSEQDLRRAIIHELEHVRRGDWLVQLGARATLAIYWFHPLAWMAWRRLSLEAERACDDAVLEQAERTDYAGQLVLLARRLNRAGTQAAVSMARRTDLSARVRAVLDPLQSRGRATPATASVALLVALFSACALGPVRGLAQNPAPQILSDRTKTLNLELFEASERGDLGEIDRLLTEGADVNAVIDGDGSPLIAAARRGHNEAVARLLDRGANPNLGVDGDGSPLIVAALKGHLSTVRLLLDRGADIHMPVEGDGNPLIMAARGGNVEVVELLLDRGANTEQVVPGDENALIEASASGHLTVVKLLVNRGANVNARVWANSNEWRTPLSMARRNSRAAVVEYLVSVGARE